MVTASRPAIDVRNLYYMFLYAWRAFEGGSSTLVRATEATDLVELFAKLLIREASYLVGHRLDQGYRSSAEETSSPRGRLLLSESMKRGSLQRNRPLCLIDELTSDLLHNQILKATITGLLSSRRVDRSLTTELQSLSQHFQAVAPIHLTTGAFFRTRLTRNTRHYRLALKVCELLHTHLLVGEGDSESSFAALLRDEEKMHRLFEEFVRNFYAVEQGAFRVSSPQVPWATSDPTHPDNLFLPAMRTDIMLQGPTGTIIIDTKFYGEILKGRNGQKVRSAHLYQILTYLSQWHLQKGDGDHPCGMLLYAQPLSEEVDLTYEIGRFPIRVRSIDLSRPWSDIHSTLLLAIDASPRT
jgi:5-methylcytosine-specific restriction enzyme subunit McrC